jgi:hypothetical protein
MTIARMWVPQRLGLAIYVNEIKYLIGKPLFTSTFLFIREVVFGCVGS